MRFLALQFSMKLILCVDTVNEFSIPPFDPPVLGFNFTRNSVDHSTALLDTAVIVDSSTPILQRSTPNFDWMFPPLTPSQNEFDSLQGIGLNISSQEGTPEFDPLKTNFSITDFSNNNVSHLSAEADKAAKQRKLMEMKEATRRLEAEIAASYVPSPPIASIAQLLTEAIADSNRQCFLSKLSKSFSLHITFPLLLTHIILIIVLLFALLISVLVLGVPVQYCITTYFRYFVFSAYDVNTVSYGRMAHSRLSNHSYSGFRMKSMWCVSTSQMTT